MADIFSKEKRSEIMSKFRGKNTKPEKIVRKYLHAQGFRFRVHKKDLPGKPDIVLRKYKTVVFINGCFWHNHKNCKHFIAPKSRKAYWLPKLNANALRDISNSRALRKLGWRVITVWECQLKSVKCKKTLNTLKVKLLHMTN